MTSRRVWLTIPAKIHVLNAPSEYLMQSSYVLKITWFDCVIDKVSSKAKRQL